MLQKLKTKVINRQFLKDYLSIGAIGVYIALIVALSVSWASIKIIQRNYNLLKEIAVEEQQVEINEKKVANQKLLNDYYKSDDYLELAARRELNKAAPGEKLIVIPKSVALSKLPKLPAEAKTDSKELETSNWQAWLDFLSGRSISDQN